MSVIRVGAGILLDKVFVISGTNAAASSHEMLPGSARVACAVLLIVILLWARYGSLVRGVWASKSS